MAKSTRRRRPPSRAAIRRSQPSSTSGSVKSTEASASGLAPGMQAITAFLAVANVGASIDFLERVMSFSRGVTLTDPDGQLRYAEMRCGGSIVVLVRREDQASPSGGAPAIYTYVSDVDRAIANAREAGAGGGEIEDKPWGDRVGTVIDPDGYRWLLATFRKLVPFD